MKGRRANVTNKIRAGVIGALLFLAMAGNAMAHDDAKMTLNQQIGHGNITAEGPTGLFLNPTSTPLAEGELIVQYCAALLEDVENNNFNSHNALIAYGIKDWLEVGAIGKVLDVDKLGSGGGGGNVPCGPGTGGPGGPGPGPGGPGGANTPCRSDDFGAGGPFARIKVLNEAKWLPQMAVGGISIIGDDTLEQHTLFFALSKNFSLRSMGLPIDMKLNAGVKKLWFEARADDHAGYFGAEVKLPKHVYLVGEIQQETTGSTAVPWSAGVQVRHPEGYGFSLAALQPGGSNNVGVFIGVGINFE